MFAHMYYRQLIAWVVVILHWLVCHFYPQQCNNKSLQGLVIKVSKVIYCLFHSKVHFVYKYTVLHVVYWFSRISQHEPLRIIVGQVFLYDWTFYSRKYHPVGHNFLGKCVPQTHFPVDRFSCDTAGLLLQNFSKVYTETCRVHCNAKSLVHQRLRKIFPRCAL